MLRRDAACDTSRSGIVLERRHRPREERRIGAQILADDADDRHVGLDADLGEHPQVADDVVEPPRVVDGHRHAHLGGRDHVDRRPEALEHLEQPAQEAVGHQHARRGDVDDGDAALAGERRQRAAVSGRPSAVIIVPATSGRRELRMRTGMFFATAGRIVLGCSTLAPKYASSDASANDSCGTSTRIGDDARIGREHAVHVGPDLDLADVEARAEDRGRVVATRRGRASS